MKKKVVPSKNAAKNKVAAVKNNSYEKVVLLFIVIIAFFVFSPSLKNNFVNWDDDAYVYKNPAIQQLSMNSVSTFFTSGNSGMYMPVTQLTYAIIYKISGLDPSAFHFMNLFLHLLNTVLVFYLFRILKTDLWVTAFVSIFFAIHPMHVESVAWISETKDVLYSMFFLAALISYVHYINNLSKRRYYLLAIFLFMFSLLSKSAAVVFPIVLIALDYYMNVKFEKKRMFEKIPFFFLSIAFGVINLYVQQHAGATEITDRIGLGDRFLLACFSVIMYTVKFFFPTHLSNIYPFPELHSTLLWVSSFIILGVSLAIYKYGKANKDFIFGGAFFLINIILVINIIPIGQSFMAERYTYLSYIGLLFIIGQLLLKGSLKIFQSIKTYIGIAILFFVVLFSYLSHERIGVWKDSSSLWSDCIKKNPDYFYGYYALGNAQRNNKSYSEAIGSYTKVIQLNPNYALAFSDRGVAKDYAGDYTGAIADYNAALAINPELENAYINRAICNLILKKYDEALNDFNTALRKNSSNNLVYFNRGLLYLTLNRLNEACTDWEKALELGNQMSEDMILKHCNK